jgi:GntR family transcriptional regulator, transcriptional repressor for pyruvate dehydrogenase complex
MRVALPSNRERRSPKVSEVIARELADYILDAQLPEGAVLPNEKDMLGQLGVGRATLREALRLLESRGLIRVRPGPGGGPIVHRPQVKELGNALTLLLQVEGASLGDVLRSREAIEPVIARLAAARIGAEELDQLEHTIDMMLEHTDDVDVFLRENLVFHLTIARAADSVVLRIFLETLRSIADGAALGVRYTPRAIRSVAAAHRRIVEALRNHDPDGAEAAMCEHMTDTGEYWGHHYGDLVSQPVRWLQ